VPAPFPPGARPRLLVPLDGSAWAESALPLASELGRLLSADLVLVRAAHPPHRTPDRPDAFQSQEPGEMAEAEDYLRRTAERLAPELGGVEPQAEVRVEEPATAILSAAQEFGVALVVMATHGSSGLPGARFGRVAHAVLRHGRAPLLLIRPEALRR